MASDDRKIVVTGATGGLGSSVVEQLLRLTPASELGVSVRQPETAQHLAVRGIRVRLGDFDKPKTLDEMFDGAERLLIISTRTVDNHARFAQHRNAIDAAFAGIVARGVLLDIPRLRGVEFLDPGDAITPEELDAACVSRLAQIVMQQFGEGNRT